MAGNSKDSKILAYKDLINQLNKTQMSYANAKNIPFVAIVGENEMNEGKAMLKNMETGEQNLVSAEELIATVKK